MPGKENQNQVVYLLHLDPGLSQGVDPRTGRERIARHYVGTTNDLEVRLAQHRAGLYQKKGNKENGCGARFTQVAVERGCVIRLARAIWLNDGENAREYEKRWKKRHHHCPICSMGIQK